MHIGSILQATVAGLLAVWYITGWTPGVAIYADGSFAIVDCISPALSEETTSEADQQGYFWKAAETTLFGLFPALASIYFYYYHAVAKR